eukprot:COSAG06_NODE_3530_length_5224_cov_87.568865_5_plen_40_part_00
MMAHAPVSHAAAHEADSTVLAELLADVHHTNGLDAITHH